jgi:hypothetical protein
MMRSLLRRVRAARLAGTTFCEPCGQACTAACRSAARLARARDRAIPPLGLPR